MEGASKAMGDVIKGQHEESLWCGYLRYWI